MTELNRAERMPSTAAAQSHKPAGRAHRWLTHPTLLIRFSALLAVTVVAFVLVWLLSFALLPAGFMRNRSGSAILAGGGESAGSFMVECIRLFAINVAVGAGAVVAPNLLRTRRGVPMGYWSALSLVTVAAIVTGTNSFSIPVGTGTKLALSPEVLGQPGPYELAAYVLATTATFGIGRWQIVGRGPLAKAPRIRPEPLPRRQLAIGVATATLTLLVAAAWEANNIIAQGGPG